MYPPCMSHDDEVTPQSYSRRRGGGTEIIHDILSYKVRDGAWSLVFWSSWWHDGVDGASNHQRKETPKCCVTSSFLPHTSFTRTRQRSLTLLLADGAHLHAHAQHDAQNQALCLHTATGGHPRATGWCRLAPHVTVTEAAAPGSCFDSVAREPPPQSWSARATRRQCPSWSARRWARPCS